MKKSGFSKLKRQPSQTSSPRTAIFQDSCLLLITNPKSIAIKDSLRFVPSKVKFRLIFYRFTISLRLSSEDPFFIRIALSQKYKLRNSFNISRVTFPILNSSQSLDTTLKLSLWACDKTKKDNKEVEESNAHESKRFRKIAAGTLRVVCETGYQSTQRSEHKAREMEKGIRILWRVSVRFHIDEEKIYWNFHLRDGKALNKSFDQLDITRFSDAESLKREILRR